MPPRPEAVLASSSLSHNHSNSSDLIVRSSMTGPIRADDSANKDDVNKINNDLDKDAANTSRSEKLDAKLTVLEERIKAKKHPTLKSAKASVRNQLAAASTDLDVNDNDKMGDGDQSSPSSPRGIAASIYQRLFETAGDFHAHLGNWPRCSNSHLSPFAIDCVTGRFRKVRATLERNSVKSGKSLETLSALLETRETSMRYTPLLMVFVVLRKLAAAIESMESPENSSEFSVQNSKSSTATARQEQEPVIAHGKEMEENLVRVVKLLLLYGARPDAKDATGRTVVQYGAGAVTSATTLAAVDMCIGAAYSSDSFGKEVQVVNNNYHGRRGIAAGYQADTASRLVYLFGQKGEVAVLNRNLRIVQDGKTVLPKSLNLCNIQDRLGRTALREILDNTSKNDVTVAEFLLVKHGASIDIADGNGDTIRELVFHRSHVGKVSALVEEYVMKSARSEYLSSHHCVKCGAAGTKTCPLRVCRACKSVRFCSDECQQTHWQEGHKKECPKVRKEYKECIVIKDPSPRNGDTNDRITIIYSVEDVEVTAFRRPSHVAVDESFTVKAECRKGEKDSILICDRSRECEFIIRSEHKAYKQILAKILSDKVTAGTKTYVSASFDKKGYCSLFMNQTKRKTW